MADEQISFHFTDDISQKPVQEGSVIISKRDEINNLADIFTDLEGQRWQVKPAYTWDEIGDTPPIDQVATPQENGLMSAEDKTIFDFFTITKQTGLDGIEKITIKGKSLEEEVAD